MTNFVPGPALALRGRDKKNNKKGNNEEEDDEGMDDDEGKCILSRIAEPHHVNSDPDSAFHLNADPDLAFHYYADPDLAFLLQCRYGSDLLL
jgi:hypothetical protein